MKKIIFLLIIIAIKSYSQDTLRFKNGNFKLVKVTEITSGEVKYHRFDNPDGPLYVNYKSEIAYVKYANGQTDVFNQVGNPASVQSNNPAQTVIVSPVVTNDKIEIGDKKLYYNNRALGESRMYRLINACPDDAKRNKLMNSFNEMKSYKKKQYGLGFGFLGAAVASFIIGADLAIISTASSTSNGTMVPFAVGAASGATFGVTGIVLSTVFKKKRMDKLRATALIYNE